MAEKQAFILLDQTLSATCRVIYVKTVVEIGRLNR